MQCFTLKSFLISSHSKTHTYNIFKILATSRDSDNNKKRGFGNSKNTESIGDKKIVRNVKISDDAHSSIITKVPKQDIMGEQVIKKHFPSLNLQYPNMKLIHYDPPIYEIDNFLTSDLCDSYIESAQQHGYEIAQSQTFQSLSAGVESIRTSTTWYMKYSMVQELIMNTKLLLQVPNSRFEEPQIVRYLFGQQFSWHYDILPKSVLDSSGQRMATLILYLNDLQSPGGATCFKSLNLQVSPKKGKALLFFPTYSNGSIDERTMHAGQITMDTKWIAQFWIHENDYIPKLPPNNQHLDI